MSKQNFAFIGAVCSSLAMMAGAYAQQQENTPTAQPAASSQAQQQVADFIVAIVQHEVITNTQVRAHMLSLKQQLRGQEEPPVEQLRQLALQQRISQSALAQRANELGLRVDPQIVQQATMSVAKNNNMSLAEFKEMLAQQGIPFSVLERDIKQQMLIRQLRERTLDPTITVNNAEVEEYMAQFGDQADPAQQKISLAQILVSVPENATEAQIKTLQEKAQNLYTKAQDSKTDFLELARTQSDEPNAKNTDGAMGVMPANRYPDLFVKAVSGLRAGGVAAPVRSGAGFHIIKVLDREQSDLVVTQTHARHILLNISENTSEQEAIDKLAYDKRQIEAGLGTFEQLAQEQSQDASAKNGGDLGWVVPGMFVPEFEQVMNKLALGEISDPVVTRFGVHLIQVLERREAQLTPQQQREVARETIHQRKIEMAMEQWVRDVQSRAYIELRNPPQ